MSSKAEILLDFIMKGLEERKEDTVNEKMSEEDLLRELEDHVDSNDHWGAVMLLADFVGAKGVKKQAELGKQIHDDVGSLPPGLGDFRSWLGKTLHKMVKSKIKDKDIQQKIMRTV